MENIFPKA